MLHSCICSSFGYYYMFILISCKKNNWFYKIHVHVCIRIVLYCSYNRNGIGYFRQTSAFVGNDRVMNLIYSTTFIALKIESDWYLHIHQCSSPLKLRAKVLLKMRCSRFKFGIVSFLRQVSNFFRVVVPLPFSSVNTIWVQRYKWILLHDAFSIDKRSNRGYVFPAYQISGGGVTARNKNQIISKKGMKNQYFIFNSTKNCSWKLQSIFFFL